MKLSRPYRVALAVTGSVAAIRTPALYELLRAAGCDVRVIATEPSLYFFDARTLPAAADDAGPPMGRQILFRDADEWPCRDPGSGDKKVYRSGDPVLHIELRRWADILVVAPLDANTLAKFAYGFSDNVLTCLYRAWDRTRPIVLAPAMNTLMWEHPLTMQHLSLLLQVHGPGSVVQGDDPQAWIDAINRNCPHLHVLAPQVKTLACGDEGVGAMAEVHTIAAVVRAILEPPVPTVDLSGRGTTG